jgi:hypothetical protein
MSEENLKKAELIKEKIVNDYDHYDYWFTIILE